MVYRCPYCGEPAFSLRIKLGIVSKFGASPRCPHCKRLAQRSMNHGGGFGYYWLLSLLALLTVLGFAGAAKYHLVWPIPLVLTLLVSLYLLSQYFLFHFDKCYEKERRKEPIFQFISDTDEKLWPTVRAGEIYVLSFAKEGMRGSSTPRVIGMMDRMERNSNGWLFSIRIIAFQDMTKIFAGDKLQLVTDGMLTVSGMIAECEETLYLQNETAEP